jgi:hypothetical protein
MSTATLAPPPPASSVEDAAPPRHATIDVVAWSPLRELGYRDWALEGRRIGLMGRGSPWWIGDWLLYGTARWGEMYVTAAKITGYDRKSLRNMRYVSSRFDLSLRRDNLSWSHHALLASFDPEAQCYWLERAIGDRLSVEDLRGELRAERRGGFAPRDCASAGADEGVVITCPSCGERVPVPTAALVR